MVLCVMAVVVPRPIVGDFGEGPQICYLGGGGE